MIQTKKIQLLPEHIIDQIKAGEVIEKPANLLKELLENAVDAQADKIDIHIVNNGLELISVKDNGHGIASHQLDLAFCRHATSKLKNFDDLFKLYTFGFRGEALASMASISKLSCESHHPESQTASIIKFCAGKQEQFNELAFQPLQQGTLINCRDLFFNTPARLKFSQSQTSEKNALKKTIDSFLLSQPQIHFTVKWDHQDKEIYPKEQSPQLRVKKVFKHKSPVEELTYQYDQITLNGFFSHHSSKGASHRKNYLFINGRLFHDIRIHKILNHGLSFLWGEGMSGDYALFIELPTHHIDINVHPRKTQVKIFEANKLYSLISQSLKKLQQDQCAKEYHQHHTSDLEEQKDLFTTTQDTRQEYDFSDLSLNIKTTRREQSLQHQKGSTSKFTLVHVLGHNLSLVRLQQELSHLYVLDQQKLFGEYLKDKLLNGKPREIFPLLISEPIDNIAPHKDSFFSAFHQCGIELDRIDEKTVVLRSIADWMNQLPFKSIIQILLINLSVNNSFEENIKQITQDESVVFPLHSMNIEALVEYFNIHQMTRISCLKELTENNLRSLI